MEVERTVTIRLLARKMGVVQRGRLDHGCFIINANLHGASARWCIGAIQLKTMKRDALPRVSKVVDL